MNGSYQELKYYNEAPKGNYTDENGKNISYDCNETQALFYGIDKMKMFK